MVGWRKCNTPYTHPRTQAHVKRVRAIRVAADRAEKRMHTTPMLGEVATTSALALIYTHLNTSITRQVNHAERWNSRIILAQLSILLKYLLVERIYGHLNIIMHTKLKITLLINNRSLSTLSFSPSHGNECFDFACAPSRTAWTARISSFALFLFLFCSLASPSWFPKQQTAKKKGAKSTIVCECKQITLIYIYVCE